MNEFYYFIGEKRSLLNYSAAGALMAALKELLDSSVKSWPSFLFHTNQKPDAPTYKHPYPIPF